MWAQQRKQVGLKSKASSLRKGTINGTPEVPFMAVGKETAERAVTEVALAQKAEFSCWKTAQVFGMFNRSSFSLEIAGVILLWGKQGPLSLGGRTQT